MEDTTPDYGKCPCTGQYQNRTIEVRMTVKPSSSSRRDVPLRIEAWKAPFADGTRGRPYHAHAAYRGGGPCPGRSQR